MTTLIDFLLSPRVRRASPGTANCLRLGISWPRRRSPMSPTRACPRRGVRLLLRFSGSPRTSTFWRANNTENGAGRVPLVPRHRACLAAGRNNCKSVSSASIRRCRPCTDGWGQAVRSRRCRPRGIHRCALPRARAVTAGPAARLPGNSGVSRGQHAAAGFAPGRLTAAGAGSRPGEPKWGARGERPQPGCRPRRPGTDPTACRRPPGVHFGPALLSLRSLSGVWVTRQVSLPYAIVGGLGSSHSPWWSLPRGWSCGPASCHLHGCWLPSPT